MEQAYSVSTDVLPPQSSRKRVWRRRPRELAAPAVLLGLPFLLKSKRPWG